MITSTVGADTSLMAILRRPSLEFTHRIFSAPRRSTQDIYMISMKEQAPASRCKLSGLFIRSLIFRYLCNRQQTTSVFDRAVKFNWQETGTSVGVRVPLILTRSKYIEKIDIRNTLGITQVSSFENVVSRTIFLSVGKPTVCPRQRYLNMSLPKRGQRPTFFQIFSVLPIRVS